MTKDELLQFFDPFPEAMLLVGPDGGILGANSAAGEKLGIRREELRGRRLQDLLTDPREEVEHYLHNAARTRTLLLGRLNARSASGESLEFRAEAALAQPRAEHGSAVIVLRLLPRQSAVGQFVALNQRIEDLGREIQRRAAAEAAGRASEERFRFMAESMPQKIFTASASGDVDYVNGHWEEFTGLSRDQIRGWNWTQFIHPEDLAENVRQWRKAIEEKIPFEFEHRFRRRDGAYRWHLSRARPMEREGEVLMWVGSSTDIHDQKEAEAALRAALGAAEKNEREAEAASRAKDDFLAALSHELRTPLTPVLMAACDLEANASLPADVREQLKMMCQNIELEARLIDDLLDITRISHGKLQIRRSLADIHELLAHTESIVRSGLVLTGTELRMRLEAPVHHALVDPVRIQQVFWNLLKNALKFTLGGGSVVARTFNPEPGRLAIEINDTGIGIAPGALERIFRPFDQGHIGGRHQFGGLGLGLAISKAIVDLHGGTLRAASEGIGKGATFTVELAAVRAGPGDMPPAPQKLPVPHQHLRLLVVEDHAQTRAILVRLLERAGHHVVSASTVADALKEAAAQEFDAVISDLGLPDGTGFDLMRQLRARYHLPGIALSGFGMDSDLEASDEAGFYDHLVKPVEMDRLRHALANIPRRK